MLSVLISFWRQNKDRAFAAAAVLLILYACVRSVVKAAFRPFWFDELCTWILVHQPNLGSLWASLLRAADSHPPPFYLVEKFFSTLSSNDQISFRLPAALGFCCMLGCIFIWLRRRHAAGVAFIACLIFFLTPIYTIYAAEARGYGLVVGFLGLALVAYQRMPKLGWTFVLGFSLVAAQSFHFYSFIMMAPFFVAEAGLALKTKAIRWRVWGALFAGVLPLLVFYPILAHIKGYYTEHPWLHANFFKVLKIYGWLLGVPRDPAGEVSWRLVPSIAVSMVCIGVALFFIYRALRADPEKEPCFHEELLAAAFLLLPFILFVVVKITHGAFAPRYLLPVVFGMVFAAARGVERLSGKSVALVGGLLCVTIAAQEAAFWLSFYGDYQLGFSQPKKVETLVAMAGHADLPVVLSDGKDYLETDHYATSEWKSRLTYVVDYPAALAHGRSDFNDKELLALRDFARLRVVEYPQFKKQHSVFLLYSDPTDENNPDWFVAWLSEEGWSLQSLKSDGHSTVFLVQQPGR